MRRFCSTRRLFSAPSLHLYAALLLAPLFTAAPGLRAQSPAASPMPIEQPTVLVSATQRHATSLNGPWHFIPDPYRNGWGGWPDEPSAPSPNGFVADKHFDPRGPVQEYNWPDEPELAVPGDWNSQRAELLYYEGLVWYQRNFTYHPAAGMRSFLHFGAASYRANVTVNGKNVCEHQGAFTSFDCDATAALKDGDNSIVVAVDNVRKRERVPTTKTDWWNYGGLTGEVSIVEVPAAGFIDEDRLWLERGAGDHVSGRAHVEGVATGTPVHLRLPELHVDVNAKTDAQGIAHFSFEPKGLERWSPEHARLYRVEWQVGSDQLADTIGFRTVEVRGGEILLNGKPIYLKGVNMHAEAPRSYAAYPESKSGRAWSEADARLTLGYARALGCNFVRMAHYPYPDAFLREADRAGLLVWSEIPVYWSIDWTSPEALASAKSQLHEQILRDGNRASIALWSMSNETPPSPDRTEFIHKLIDQARAEDPTRLITSAMVTPFHKDAEGNSTATLDDPLVPYLDVLGYNEYIGWYTGKSDDAPSYRWSDPSGKPVIVSEFGAGAKTGMHGDVRDRFTEEFQAHLFEKQFEMIDKMPFVRGTTPWVLMDFRSPTRLLPGIQDGYNRKGLVSLSGEHKAAFEVVRRQYAKTPAQMTAH
ncbi:glycoside hydrolase family 2 protein [Acidipila sp. EB88]|uniref:glycoside hydrolase family 2 protein n=1 Tax=Acidipila sp. EB88 TaxID=2305226 RepID=UPI001315618D|nr:glycoside hydrolase family 2 TIM barrel-domain containing protein [Acidipila sp. EB88]